MNLVSRDDLAAMQDYYSGEDHAEVGSVMCTSQPAALLWQLGSAGASAAAPLLCLSSVSLQTRAKCWLFISYLIAFGAVAGRCAWLHPVISTLYLKCFGYKHKLTAGCLVQCRSPHHMRAAQPAHLGGSGALPHVHKIKLCVVCASPLRSATMVSILRVAGEPAAVRLHLVQRTAALGLQDKQQQRRLWHNLLSALL